jgi:hypothetical protein
VCAAGVVAPIDVTGGIVSIVHVYEAGLGSVFAAVSVARTWKVCDPSARAVYVFGVEQEVKAAASSLHWNVEPASVDEKSNVAPVAIVRAAGWLGPIDVSGGVASIVHAYESGDASTLPAGSIARTWKVCGPSAIPEYACGVVHDVKLAASSLHSKEDPGCVAENEKLGAAVFESADGCAVIDVSGGTVSIVQLVLDVVPAFPARSAAARTENVCGPSASGPYAAGLEHAANAAAST